LISRADIEEAAGRVAGVIRPTPLSDAAGISSVAGCQVLVKPEYRQRTGSFKLRGAYNFISRLPAGTEVVAASAGNHAQGVALAASLLGLRSTIFMPINAPLPKVEATRNYGATVRLEGMVVDECLAAAKAHAGDRGVVYVPPFDDPLVIAGQGTVGLEIASEAPDDVETVVVPVGGGGLISGIATALAHSRRGVRVIGVEPEGAAAMRASLDAKRCVTLESVSTMADGVAVKSPSELTLAHVQAYVDDVVTVTEEELSRALLLLLERSKAVVEPAAATAVAALLGDKVPRRGPAVAVLSGGNIDPLLLMRVIDHGLSAAGRYLLLRIILDDKPGALAALTAAVAELGLNVRAGEHHPAGVRLDVGGVEVLFTEETRDPAHREEVVEALRRRRFRVEHVR
jgi:threonine dehydratase